MFQLLLAVALSVPAQPFEGYELDGKVQLAPGRVAVISPNCNSIILNQEDIKVKLGDRVKKGDELFRMDPPATRLDLSRSQLAQAEASADFAKKEFARFAELVRSHAISQSEHDSAECAHIRATQDLRNAKCQLALEEVNYGYYIVKAPIDGVVVDLSGVVPGAVSAPGRQQTVWGKILDDNEVDVCCYVSPATANEMKSGMDATAGAATGKVWFISPVAVNDNKVQVLIRIDNAKKLLRVGQVVKTRIPMSFRSEK